MMAIRVIIGLKDNFTHLLVWRVTVRIKVVDQGGDEYVIKLVGACDEGTAALKCCSISLAK